MSDPVVICGDPMSRCVCRLPHGHEGNHACLGPTALQGQDSCLGVWTPERKPVVFPDGRTEVPRLFDLFLGLFDDDDEDPMSDVECADDCATCSGGAA